MLVTSIHIVIKSHQPQNKSVTSPFWVSCFSLFLSVSPSLSVSILTIAFSSSHPLFWSISPLYRYDQPQRPTTLHEFHVFMGLTSLTSLSLTDYLPVSELFSNSHCLSFSISLYLEFYVLNQQLSNKQRTILQNRQVQWSWREPNVVEMHVSVTALLCTHLLNVYACVSQNRWLEHMGSMGSGSRVHRSA